MDMERTQEEKILSGLSQIAVLFSWVGLVANIVLFVIYRPKSTFVAKHAKQALGLQVVWMVVNLVIGTMVGAGAVGLGLFSMRGGMPAAGFGSLFLLVAMRVGVGLAFLVLAVMGAIKGFQGQEHRYPVIGDFVDRLGE